MQGTTDVRSGDAPFDAFVAASSPRLLRTAWLLTGSEASAQDLVQTALLKTWMRWGRLRHPDVAEPYVRRVMVSTFLSWRRRRWAQEWPVDTVDDRADHDRVEPVEVRIVVRAALSGLPKGQRAAVVLRYFEDLTETQAAAAMGCSVGTVKSQTAPAVARLRADPQMAALWTRQGPDDDA